MRLRMKGYLRAVTIALISLFLISVAAGCAKTGDQAPATKGEKLLRLGAVKDFKEATEGKNLIFERFVGVDREGNPVPQLAESWDVSEDGKAYTFHLRKGVKFHNGTVFDASTAKFAFQWIANQAPFGGRVKFQ